MFYFDPVYFIFIIPGLILAGFASLTVKSTFQRFSDVYASSGLTGAQAAEKMLRNSGIYDVAIERTEGYLSDHYDPSAKVLRLSPSVYGSRSLAAIGVACHEAGHAIQHAAEYPALAMRTTFVPFAQFCPPVSYIVIFLGFLMQSQQMVLFGCILFSAAVVFALITLPVEWDASARAKKQMVACGIVTDAEREHAGSVLNAAFLTYVAAAVSSLLTLLYYLYRAGLLGGRRDD